ncbi:MAG: glutaredoxin family protein [Candidatus Parcubacteria bacterium]|nr:glutaredoxin family protein [Burkholderiales bacterium]
MAILIAAAVCSPTQAQQYRWMDKNGKVQFTDTPPPAGARDVRRNEVVISKPAPPPVPFELQRLQKDFPVTLYTSPNCREGCDLSRLALNRRGVPFKEMQVWDAESNEELKRISGAVEVPTLLVGRSVQRGFEQGAFDSLLDSAGYPKLGILPAATQKAPPPPEGYVPAAVAAKPALPAGKAAEVQPKAGRYDPSGLTGPAPKSGQYDPSGLTGPAPKPGQYGIPGESK